MLQSEYLRLPVGPHIPEAFHAKLDRLARWVRGGQWLEVEADLILEAMLEYLQVNGPSIRHQYRRLCLWVETMSDMDDREYLVPSFQDFRHLLRSIPNALVKQCRIGPPKRPAMSHDRRSGSTPPLRDLIPGRMFPMNPLNLSTSNAPSPSSTLERPSPDVGLRRRPNKVVRFGKDALEAAIAVAAAGDENAIDVWIAFDNFINKRNRALRLDGTAPLRVPSLPRFLKLVDQRIGLDLMSDEIVPLKTIVAPKTITTAELARLARAEVMKAYAKREVGQGVSLPIATAAPTSKGRR